MEMRRERRNMIVQSVKEEKRRGGGIHGKEKGLRKGRKGSRREGEGRGGRAGAPPPLRKL